MEMIIARSGLSTGAVYGYFKGKDQIISAVVTDGTAEMGRHLAPVLTNPEPPPPPAFIEQILHAVTGFGRQKKGDIDRVFVSLHGWSHSQSNPELQSVTRAAYSRLNKAFVGVVGRWQTSGAIDPATDPKAVAQLLTSITLGFIAQRALTGHGDAKAHAAALEALSNVSDLNGSRSI
jgi:AcrR family transcriptional regulator